MSPPTNNQSSSKGKVLLAMSGGVDSSVAAALLLDQGYEVVGCFMRLGSPGESIDTPTCETDNPSPSTPLRIGKQGCCSINDAADARLVAAQLGIPFYVCNFKNDFSRIIDYFVDEYAQGRTPNPCVRCNDWLKFGKLHDYAKQIGADFIASGHYARIDHSKGDPQLLRGIDATKDQSYVLFGAPKDRLAEMLLPIGSLEKSHVRDIAKQKGLPVFDKPDSQEICFVPNNDYASLIEKRRPDLAKEGPILDQEGNTVGHHQGQHRMTIGQRKGIGIALGHPIFVTHKDPKTNTVTIGPREALMVESCQAAESNWLTDPAAFSNPAPVMAQYRYNANAVPATCQVTADNTFNISFNSPQEAVAPGQAIVIYDQSNPDQVLGGGWITHAK